ncbi:hypothetical protein PIB30_067325 [Stylosanthes scabra]|uniref:Uncharacterized protein n=1 Tax=Stylosanthes scabra TaxID=79078 RepID=A0ABU6SNK9_9FABA|nr:hypothetical protein [Stylosanthes scabra]
MSVLSSGKCVRLWFGTCTGPVGLAMITNRTFQVQVQAWKVEKHVVSCCDLDSPVESSVCSATVSAERVRSAVSHTGVLQFLVSEQFFPSEPDEWNCYALEHDLNQRIMRKMLPKAII